MPIGVYKRTKKTRLALSRSRLGVSPWNKGKRVDREKHPSMGHFAPHSEIAKKKMKKNHRGMVGKKHSQSSIEKIISSQKGRPQPRGELSAHWKGGGRKFKCAQVLKRDDFTCQICKFRDREIMQVDHKKERCLGGDDSLDNLQTLCPNCHARKTVGFLKRKRK